MPRQQRREPTGWQHVMNRGIRRHDIFASDGDRYLFLSCLREAARDHSVAVVAFCLMGNHYHLILESAERGLSAMMRDFTARYARTFNRRHDYDGPLFRSRFSSKEIVTDAQLLVATRYVHRNPLELGHRIDDHPWSSYRSYLGAPSTGWVDARTPLALAGGAEEYRRFVEAPMAADRFSLSDGVVSVAASTSPTEEIERLAEAVCAVADRQGSSPATCRRAAAVVGLDRGIASAEIASHFGFVSAGAVRTAASRARVKALDDPDLADLIRSLASALPAPDSRQAS